MSIVEKAMEKLDRDGGGRDKKAKDEASSDDEAGHTAAGHTAAGHTAAGRTAALEVHDEEMEDVLRPPSERGSKIALTPAPPDEPEAEHPLRWRRKALLQPEARAGLPATLRIDIDVEHLRRAGLAPPADCIARVADEYRRIKRPLLAQAFGTGMSLIPDGNLIMIGSSLPGEGKTFTTMNLALSIVQELDRTVLLVDADVAKPHISRVLGLGDRPGLIDVLLDEEAELQDVLVSTDIDALKVLPAGPPHHQSTELLASERMRQLVAEMSQRYADRVLIFDTPPLLATTEAQVMAGLMGQIVIVVNAGSTPQQAVLQALETLDPAKSIQLVLNKNRAPWGDDYYGSYYGYE